MSPKIQIEIDTDDLLPDLSYDEDGMPDGTPGAPLQALVIDAAARQIIRSDSFDREVKGLVQRRTEEIVNERVEAAVGDLVAEAIKTPIQRRHPWGDAIGEPITVREIIRDHVEKFFKVPASRDPYRHGGQEKGLAEMVQNLTREALGTELKAEVDAARKEVGDQIRDKALKAAVAAIAPR